MLSQEALQATGLAQPGSLVRWTYRLDRCRTPPSDDAGLTRFAAEVEGAPAGSRAGTSARGVNADPRFARNIERFTQFLTLVGLTALLVGGVGVANAVRGFVDRKRASIATLKCLGAPGGQVVVALPRAGHADRRRRHRDRARRRGGPALHRRRPVRRSPADPARAGTRPWRNSAIALLYGVLTALVFSLGAARAGRTTSRSPACSATRSTRSGAGRAGATSRPWRSRSPRWSRWRSSCPPRPAVALIFIGGDGGGLRAAAPGRLGLMALARRAAASAPHRAAAGARQYPSPRRADALGRAVARPRPHAAGDARAHRRQHPPPAHRTPAGQAPSFFFLDIPSAERDAFDAFLQEQAPGRDDRARCR